jgi:hypothetical protein
LHLFCVQGRLNGCNPITFKFISLFFILQTYLTMRHFTKRFGGILLFFALNLFTLNIVSAQSCGVPTNIRYFDPFATTITVYWDAVPNAIAYQVLMRPVGSLDWSINVRASSNAATIRTLVARTNYEFVVSTICATGQSSYCAPTHFSTNVDCVPPININCGSITTNSATLQWSSVAAATKYRIDFKASNETIWHSVETTNTAIALTGLTGSMHYQYKICAICPACAAIECTPILTFTTLGAPSCGIPINLTATVTSPSTAILGWSAVSGATAYQVRLRPQGTASWTQLLTTNTNSVLVSNLTANTTYEWEVAATCGSTQGIYCTISIFRTPNIAICDAPTGLRTVGVTVNSASIAWNSVSSASKYIIEYKANSETTWRSIEVTGATTATLTGLLSNTSYQFRVCAVCPGCEANGCSVYCPFTTLPQPTCGIASNLDENSITTSSVNLFWSAVSGASSYRVRLRVRGTSTWTSQISTLNTSLVVSGLAANTTYEWSVQTICSYTEGVYCDVGIFTTLPVAVCNPPTNLKVLSVTATSAQISWTGVSNAAKYIIEYRPVGATSFSSIETTGTSATLIGLLTNANYQFRVCAICPDCVSTGCSAWCPFTTLGNVSCGIPSNLDEYNITTSSAQLRWTGVAGATYYRVRVREVGTLYWAEGTVYNTYANASYLDPNTTYEWQVLAVCNGVSGAYCISSTFTTLGICGTPTGLYANTITATNATLNWSSIGSASKYSVEYRIVGETIWKKVETTGTALTINNLTPNANYEFRVCAICVGCIDPFCSAICAFRTSSVPCVAPTNLTAINITATGATLTWSAVANATKYTVHYMPVGEAVWRSVDVTTNSLTVNDLSPNVSYVFRVCTMCAGSSSSFCSVDCGFSTIPLPCVAPTNLGVTNVSTTGATLTWNAVAGISTYTVEYMLTTEPVWRTATTTTNSLTITDLSPNTQYLFRVCITCPGHTTMTCSSTYYFQTLGQVCGVPSNLVSSNITQTSVNLNWVGVSGATSYHVRVRPVGTTTWVEQGTVNSTSASVTGLTAGTTYEWQVLANCNFGAGVYCGLAQFQTLSPPAVTNNDEICQHTNLTVNSTLIYTNGTNQTATQSLTPSVPSVACGCPSTAYDVWYKVDMPSTGVMTVSVAGDGNFDPVVALYYGNSCTDICYLACRFDNSNPAAGSSPTISLSGTPGLDIYIRVWGYNGTRGTFRIGVTNTVPSYGSLIANRNLLQQATEQKTALGFDNVAPVTLVMPLGTAAAVKPKEFEVKAYPNPVKQSLTVDYTLEHDAQNVSISMSDISGRVVYVKNTEGVIGVNNHIINVENMATGTYILKVMHKNQQKVQRIQVVH